MRIKLLALKQHILTTTLFLSLIFLFSISTFSKQPEIKYFKGFSLSFQAGGVFCANGDYNKAISANSDFFQKVFTDYSRSPFFSDLRYELEYSFGSFAIGLESGYIFRKFKQTSRLGKFMYRNWNFSVIPVLANFHFYFLKDEHCTLDFFAGGGIFIGRYLEEGLKDYNYENIAHQISAGFQLGSKLEYYLKNNLTLTVTLNYQFSAYNKMKGEGITNSIDPYFQSYDGNLHFIETSNDFGFHSFVLGDKIGSVPAKMYLMGLALRIGLKWQIKLRKKNKTL